MVVGAGLSGSVIAEQAASKLGNSNRTYKFRTTEVGIYIRKQESKKTRNQELAQESDQEKKKVFSLFLGCFLGQVLVFLFS